MAEKDEDIVERAQKRFKRCQEWESDARKLYTQDMRFLIGDPDNNFQWPDQVRYQRQIDGRPMLTINKTHQHWLQVVNDGKQNKPSVKVHPVGDGADYDSAQVFEGIIRHIEYRSNAQSAYDKASENQCGGGIGYWRIITDYMDDNGFDQEIRIKPIRDSLSVFIDPDIKEQDGSDARFAFVYTEWPKDEFQRKYPDSEVVPRSFSGGYEGWVRENSVIVSEYYEVEEKKKRKYAIPTDDGPKYIWEDELSKEEKKLLKTAQIPSRMVNYRKIHWYLIAANKVIDQKEWAGKYIPIIRVVGEETIIENRLDRKGIVRYMKDAQRMYNYNTSSQVEFGALQGKTPYIAPIEAIEGHENYWATANRENHSILPFNHADENGNPIPVPQRQQPPASAPAFLEGAQAAAQEMAMTSGQYEATFGQRSNEISGRAIDQRQRQGDRATYHFIDGLAKAIRFTGKQLIDLIPKIYDTERIIRILGEDGEEESVRIDPNQQKALSQSIDPVTKKAVDRIFNPSVGQYDVVADVGPSYDTRREEAFNAIKEILTGNPALTQVVGDLLFKAADFPMAKDLQERMKNWIPANIRGEGPTPQEQELMQHNQMLMQQNQQLMQQIKDKTAELQIRAKDADIRALNHLGQRMDRAHSESIDAYKADTDRLKAVLPVMGDEGLKEVIRKLLVEIMQTPDLIIGNQTGEQTGAEAYGMGLISQNVQQ